MIHESSPWKAALAHDANMIERWAAKPRSSERRSFLLEQKIFLAAYSLRKLDEATKFSTEILANPIQVQRYAVNRLGYAAANNFRFDDYFDLANPQKNEITGRQLVNLLIHSLVFVEVLAEDLSVAAFLVTSDREAVRGLVEVDLTAFTDLMRRAAEDYPTEIIRSLDINTKRPKS
jgi:hypothetical protein